MNPSEAAIVLTFAAAYDRRTVGEADAKAWALALPHVRVKDAQAAIVEHYTESREFLMPSDVGRIVRRQRTDAHRDITPPPPPRELASEPKREVLWTRTWLDAVMDGSTHDAATAIANAALNIEPEIEPLAIGAGDEKMQTMQDAMQRNIAETARLQSLIRQENEARAAEFEEKKRRHRESADAQDADAKAERDATQATTTKEQV